MPYTAPATVVTATTITSAWGNSVKAATDYLANPPACRVFNNASISCANASVTYLTFNSERFDTNAMHDTSSLTGRITFTTAGLYVVTGSVELIAATDYLHAGLLIRLNGTTNIVWQNNGSIVNSTVAVGISATTIYKFAAGDYIELGVYQQNSAVAARNVAAIGNYTPEFSATWIGLG